MEFDFFGNEHSFIGSRNYFCLARRIVGPSQPTPRQQQRLYTLSTRIAPQPPPPATSPAISQPQENIEAELDFESDTDTDTDTDRKDVTEVDGRAPDVTTEARHWVLCEACMQWRIVDEKYSSEDEFFCSLLKNTTCETEGGVPYQENDEEDHEFNEDWGTLSSSDKEDA